MSDTSTRLASVHSNSQGLRDDPKHFNCGNYANEAEIYGAYSMELLGPPLARLTISQ
jgi:hypothetical protein